MEENKFGQVDILLTESIGVPGKRIFRILVDSRSGYYATIWVEKEQVFALATTLKKIVLENNNNEDAIDKLSQDRERKDSNIHIEFTVSHASISYEDKGDFFVFQFYGFTEVESELESSLQDSSSGEFMESPMLEFSINRTLAETFIEQSLNECASGRGTDSVSRNSLIVSGKVNPSTNGHFHKQ